jgi:hypothetical protein
MSNWKQMSDQYGYTADCTPNSELITTSKIRLVGSIFNGATLDTNFWTATVSTGTVTQASSELVLTSGTANAHYAKVHSVRRANWITGTSNKFRAQMRVGSSDADVTVRFGVGWGATMPTITDGAYFKFVGSTVSVNTMANTSETSVASGSFNGTYTAPTLTNNNTYEILYTLGKVYFLINNVLVHTATFATTHWTNNTVNFHIFADVTNTGDSSAIAHTFRMMNITRLGAIITKPIYKYISGAAATHVLKLGGGVLHKIIFNNTTGTSVTIYDAINAVTANTTVALITTTTSALGSWDYEMPFFNGLTIKTIGDNLDATVIYE